MTVTAVEPIRWELNVASLDFIPITVQVTTYDDEGVQSLTPVTSFDVAIVAAFVQVSDGDWHDCDALSGAKGVLVGPAGTITLAPGDYVIWVRYDASPQKPVVVPAGFLTITTGG